MYQVYRIEYPHRNVVQYKLLIPHCAYKMSGLLPAEVGKRYLKRITRGNEWFTDKSPIYAAISSGILECYGGPVQCIITKLIS